MLVLVLALAGIGLVPVLADPGDSRAEPAPFGAEVAAGPWRLAVAEVVTGAAATELVQGASPLNDPPRDGFTFVAIRIAAVNGGDRPLEITGDDFALITSAGVVRRFTGAVVPDPPLDGIAQPGETRDGWIVLGAPIDDEMQLLFDSISLTGAWADRVFALSDTTDPPTTDGGEETNSNGVEPDDPAGVGDAIVTDSWRIELLGIASCEEVYAMSDFRVQALGEGDAYDFAPWLALNVSITNNGTGGQPAYLSSTAFMLVESDGSTTSNVITLTAPSPDAAGAYYPGAEREGWVAFELPASYVDSGTTLVRFLPFRGAPDPRYLTFGDEWVDCRR